MKIKVKICGIRSLDMATVAIDSGADFLGFNFVPDSKRYITVEKVKDILQQLQTYQSLPVSLVGVFQNQPFAEVNTIAEFLHLDFVQLHGDEDMNYIPQVKRKVIKSIHRERAISSYPFGKLRTGELQTGNLEYFLLDRFVQGEGEMVDVSYAKEIAEKAPIFLAGGLTPDNVAKVVEEVKPFAVDVAGGIETNGLPDLGKIKKFIANAKGVNL